MDQKPTRVSDPEVEYTFSGIYGWPSKSYVINYIKFNIEESWEIGCVGMDENWLNTIKTIPFHINSIRILGIVVSDMESHMRE